MANIKDLRSDRIHKLAKKAKRIIPDLHIKKEKTGSVDIDYMLQELKKVV